MAIKYFISQAHKKVPYHYRGMIGGIIIEGTQSLSDAKFFDDVEDALGEREKFKIYIGHWSVCSYDGNDASVSVCFGGDDA